MVGFFLRILCENAIRYFRYASGSSQDDGFIPAGRRSFSPVPRVASPHSFRLADQNRFKLLSPQDGHEAEQYEKERKSIQSSYVSSEFQDDEYIPDMAEMETNRLSIQAPQHDSDSGSGSDGSTGTIRRVPSAKAVPNTPPTTPICRPYIGRQTEYS
ncbi:hypothetical protein APHAL10511_003349 [Amanita phalloides]|nr:hypothetical protein APHAL10511_003349 [Amanita phalloides]